MPNYALPGVAGETPALAVELHPSCRLLNNHCQLANDWWRQTRPLLSAHCDSSQYCRPIMKIVELLRLERGAERERLCARIVEAKFIRRYALPIEGHDASALNQLKIHIRERAAV